MAAIPEGDEFQHAWSLLSGPDRRRIRRLVRMGRRLDTGEEAAVAVGFARFQRARTWVRLFWLWFVPGVIVALGIAARIHPVAVGAVLALAGQSVYARRNLSRAEKVNADLLQLPGPPQTAGA